MKTADRFDFNRFDLLLAFAGARLPLAWYEQLFLHKCLKKKLLRGRTTFCCAACSRVQLASDATLEHIVPLSKGGGYEPWNLTLTCRKCNNKRGNRQCFWEWRVQRHRQARRRPVALFFWTP